MRKALEILVLSAQGRFLIGGDLEDFGIELVQANLAEAEVFAELLLENFLAWETLESFCFWGDPCSRSNLGNLVPHSSIHYNHSTQYR